MREQYEYQNEGRRPGFRGEGPEGREEYSRQRDFFDRAGDDRRDRDYGDRRERDFFGRLSGGERMHSRRGSEDAESRNFMNEDMGSRRSRNYGRSGYRNTEYEFGSGDESYGSREQNRPASFTYTEVWLIPGPESGRGPRNYQRSDDRISEDVNERLTQHGQLNASDMEVSVSDGEVTLKGMVDNRKTKRMAEDVAESVSGVKDVQNQLRVRRAAKGQGATGQADAAQTETKGGPSAQTDKNKSAAAENAKSKAA